MKNFLLKTKVTYVDQVVTNSKSYVKEQIDYQVYGHHSDLLDTASFIEHRRNMAPVFEKITGETFKLKTMVRNFSEMHAGTATSERLIHNCHDALAMDKHPHVDKHVREVLDLMSHTDSKPVCRQIIANTEGGFESQFIYLRNLYNKEVVTDKLFGTKTTIIEIYEGKKEYIPQIVERLEEGYNLNNNFLGILCKLNDFCLVSDSGTFLGCSQSLIYIIGVKIAIPALKILVQTGVFKQVIEQTLSRIKPLTMYRVVTNKLFLYPSISITGVFLMLKVDMQNIMPFNKALMAYLKSQKPVGFLQDLITSGNKNIRDLGFLLGRSTSSFMKGVLIAFATTYGDMIESLKRIKKN